MVRDGRFHGLRDRYEELKRKGIRVYNGSVWRWCEFTGVTLGLLAFCLVVFLRDPDENGFILCGFRRVTGLYCPGCGLTRAAYWMMHLKPLRAIRCHAFSPLIFAFFLWLYAAYFGRRLGIIRKPFDIAVPDWVICLLCGLYTAYCLARNLPGFSFLLP